MSKILIIGDVHFGDHSNKDIEKEQLYAFEQIAALKKTKTTFFCGDIIHNSNKISTNTLSLIKRCIYGGSNYSISGNHDQENDNFFTEENVSFSTSKTYIDYSGFISNLDNSAFHGNNFSVFGIPFYRNNTGFYQALKKIEVEKRRKNILLIHQTPNTTPFSENCSDTIDINHELFKEFDLVFCGHIHEPKKLSDKFYQTGALVPLNRAEQGQKYFYVVDTKTLEVEAIPLKQKITFSEKTKIENNSKLSKKVVEKAKEFDLLAAADKYAEQNEFTDFEKQFSRNLIKKL